MLTGHLLYSVRALQALAHLQNHYKKGGLEEISCINLLWKAVSY